MAFLSKIFNQGQKEGWQGFEFSTESLTGLTSATGHAKDFKAKG